MRRIRSSSLIAMVFVAVLAIPAGAAQSAAPSYVSSEPGDGEKLHQAPERVEVTFSEPLDESSELTVRDTCGRKLDDGNVSVDANTMTVGIKLKPSGRYMVDYVAKGLGGFTGQKHGGFGFDVHMGRPCDRSSGGSHGGHDTGGAGANENDRGGKHDGGGGSGSGSGNHGGASGQDHSTMTNDGSGSSGGHSGTTHTGNGGGHSGMNHSGGGGRKHGGKQSNKHGKGHGNGHQDGSHGLLDILEQNEADGRTTASGEAGPFGPPDGTAVLLALGLSLALGVLGGWFLRMSGAR